jgi:hypothetical protein
MRMTCCLGGEARASRQGRIGSYEGRRGGPPNVSEQDPVRETNPPAVAADTSCPLPRSHQGNIIQSIDSILIVRSMLLCWMRDHATQINNCWIGVHRNLEEERAKVSKKGQNKVSRPRRMQRKSGHRQRWRGTKTASLFSS